MTGDIAGFVVKSLPGRSLRVDTITTLRSERFERFVRVHTIANAATRQSVVGLFISQQ